MSSNEPESDTVAAKSFGARWIVPVDRPAIRDASITIADDVIIAINENGRLDADVDLGEVALTPMLVNTHTHLEFSSLTEPLGKKGNPITDWIPEVISWRVQQSKTDIEIAIVSGLHESLAWGVDCLGEIATSPWYKNIDALDGDLQIKWFAERLGSDPTLVDTIIAEAQSWLQELNCGKFGDQSAGVSPHAPYSLCQELFEGLIGWATEKDLPVAMHLAESREEIEWLRSGKGPFVEMFGKLGVTSPTRFHEQPMGYLKALATAKSGLVVHGNYLSEQELEFIGQQNQLHLIYCPRTHAYFQHEPYPLESALRHGINVAIGTDSSASNPDLNVLAELKLIHNTFPELAPELIFEMGTINGARSLNFEGILGTLTPGKQGEFLTFELNSEGQLWESILG